jgi:cyclase
VVQSILFSRYLPVGKPAVAVEYLNHWGIDEIVLLDISATRRGRGPDFPAIKEVARFCHVPLTIGGGITSLEQMRELMHCGADKISLNQAAIHDPELITRSAHVFGNQCIVVSIDAKRADGGWRVYDYLSGKVLEWEVVDFAQRAQGLGAGEVLLNVVDRDGTYTGYEIDLIEKVCNVLRVPVTCAGGAKNAQDFVKVFTHTRVSAASAANFFHFTEHSVTTTKANVLRNLPIRLETSADYADNAFDSELRLMKKSDEILEELLFTKIVKEII